MDNEYVSVGAIIEKERQARQERISKALGTSIAENRFPGRKDTGT